MRAAHVFTWAASSSRFPKLLLAVELPVFSGGAPELGLRPSAFRSACGCGILTLAWSACSLSPPVEVVADRLVVLSAPGELQMNQQPEGLTGSVSVRLALACLRRRRWRGLLGAGFSCSSSGTVCLSLEDVLL